MVRKLSMDQTTAHTRTPPYSQYSCDYVCMCAFTVLREADAGFTVCSGCAFENLTRFAYCCIYGATLPTAADDKAKKQKKRRGPHASQEIKAPLKALTATQLRVR